jgi:transcriptional regulator with XRE-family HTH domain
MGSQNMQYIIHETLRRKGWQQAQMIREGDFDETTLSRIMRRLHNPQVATYKEMMEALGTPAEPMYLPRLENSTMDMLILYDAILFELERAYFFPPALSNAKVWLEELRRTGNFNEGLNLQYFLGCELYIGVLEKKDEAKIAAQALAGLRITYPDFSPEGYMGEILTAGEPRLLHVYACALASTQPDRATELLRHVIEGIERTPQDELTKEKYLAPLLLDLVKLLIKEGKHDEAVAMCDKGNHVSLRRNKGKYNPDFTFEKAKLLKDKALFLPVYCGYAALGRHGDAEAVRSFARETGYDFPTYGLEAIPYQVPPFSLERGSYAKCESPGEFIWLFRTEAEIGQAELCKGICPPSVLARIESGELTGTVYQHEAFMERLGRYTDYYFDSLLSADVFNDKQMRDEVRTLLVTRRYDDAETLLHALKERKAYRNGLGRQFILFSEATVRFGRNQRGEGYLALLTEAWNITRKGVDVDTAHRCRLTNMEITLLNQMAGYFCAVGEDERGIRLLDALRRNLIFYYEDERERMRTYIMILYNLTLYLCRAKKYERALDIISEAEKLCLKFGDLCNAYTIFGNKASAFVRLNKGEEYKPYMAISYYVADLLGFEASKTAAKKYAAEMGLDIKFL